MLKKYLLTLFLQVYLMLFSTSNTEAKVWKAKTAELILGTQSFGQAVAAAFSPDAQPVIW